MGRVATRGDRMKQETILRLYCMQQIAIGATVVDDSETLKNVVHSAEAVA